MQSTEKKLLNLQLPEDALAWIKAFKARCRAEKKTDVDTNGNNPADYQITDQFLFRCGVESLKKVESLVAPTKIETMPFKDIERILENYLQPRKRLVIAEQTKFVATALKIGESSGGFLARLRVRKLENIRRSCSLYVPTKAFCWSAKLRTQDEGFETSSTGTRCDV